MKPEGFHESSRDERVQVSIATRENCWLFLMLRRTISTYFFHMKFFKFLAIISAFLLIGSGCKTESNKPAQTAKPVQTKFVDHFCDGFFIEQNGPIDAKKGTRVAVIDSKTGTAVGGPIVNPETNEIFWVDDSGCIDLPTTTTKFSLPDFKILKTFNLPSLTPNQIVYVKVSPIDPPKTTFITKESERIYAIIDDTEIPDQFCQLGLDGVNFGPIDSKKAIRIAIIDANGNGLPSLITLKKEATDEDFINTAQNGCVDLPPTTTKFYLPTLGNKLITISNPKPDKIFYIKLDPKNGI